ncbi:hypothetical protein QN277_010916 [Acacia crassicarpa]|uniref:SHSP domain-containing protein n=1 Tax=Acacia crassicarpa TaxID=499986 RepID=A0AAE1IMN5_9FABA|nr:hypothetical protein QN277_010916 [Acacia crassicarpa]
MELELMGDKKIKRTRDENIEEEVFRCRETPSMFILFAHLQGYKRNNIEIIIIKEEGRDQSPRNEEKPIQKLVIMGMVMSNKNEEEILWFRKVFKIPNGIVVSDQIKAEYSEEECVLKICMPKFVKQICGVQIEEVKEEEFGDSSSHKVIKQFKVDVIENPNNRVLEIRNEDGEGDDEREEDGKEETEEEEKNSSEVEQNVGEESQEVISIKNIVIQSLEESHSDGVLGREVDEEIIGGIKEKEIEEPKYKIIEDRDVEVKEGTEESPQIIMKTSNTFVEKAEEEEFENINKGGSTEIQEIGKEGFEEPKEALQVDETEITEGEEQTDIEEPMLFGHVNDETCNKERCQAKKKGKTYNNESGNQESQDHDVKLMRSSQLESPRGRHINHEVIGQRESHGVLHHEIEGEVDEQGLDGLEDIKVEASSEEKKDNEQRDGVYVEISKEIDNELVEDIQVEARDQQDIIKAKGQRDEGYVKISQEVEERRESQFRENEERKKFHSPLFVAGSAFVVFLLVYFVRHTRVQKR